MRKLLFALALGASFLPALANATVVDFEDLADGAVTGVYGGIDFSEGNWNNYSSPQFPYTPSSGTHRIYNFSEPASWQFAAPVSFQGAFFAGYNTLKYDLYLGGSLVGSSGVLALSSASTFLGNSYAGLTDKVVIQGTTDYYVADDITYNNGGGAVPEPATWAMMIAGFGLAGAALRRRPTVSVTYA